MNSSNGHQVNTRDRPGEKVPLKSNWIAVFSLALGSFASVTTEFIPVGILPEVARSFEISEGSAGFMMTLPGLLAAFSAPGILLLAGKIDRKKLLIILSLILLSACLMASVAPSFAVMLISRALVGISLGAFWAMGLAVAGRLVKREDEHKATAMVFAGVTVAMILGVPLGTFVAEHFSWRGGFYVTSIIALIALSIQLVSLPKLPAESGLKFNSMLCILKSSESIKSLLTIMFLFAAYFGTYTFVKPLMKASGYHEGSITAILVGYGIAGFVSNLAASRFVANHLKRTLLGSATLMAVVLLILSMFSKYDMGTIPLLLLWGIAWGALPLCLSIWNTKKTDGNPEAATALFTFTTQISIAIGSAGGGLIVDHFDIDTAYFTGGMLAFCSVMIVIFFSTNEEASN